MNKRNFYLVVYDISNNKRRTRLHKRLQDYGTPVQYSVFECLADAEELATMKKMILRTIKPRLDQVRIYSLCEACLKKTWISAASQDVAHESASIVV